MMKNDPDILILPNENDLFHFAAKDFSQRAIAAVNDKGTFSVVLSGGHTPKRFFDILVQYEKNIPWDKVQFFFGDERYVPSNDINSNYHMAYEHLFSKMPIKKENIYPVPTDFADPMDAAKQYEQTLRDVFHLKKDELPHFDLIYLGLGDDAHTASLMPVTDIVKYYANNLLTNHQETLVASLFVPHLNQYRVTLTPPAINHAMNIIFLVTGLNKAPAVVNVLEGKRDLLHCPAQLINSIEGNIIWYLDAPAAKNLRKK